LTNQDPYDELPYRSRPIEWTAPERLALCSLLHGGPRPALDGYSVLELGCGDGANLLSLAAYRPQARFLGADGSRCAVELAESRRRELALDNLRFVHATFEELRQQLSGPFDFVLVHGVFSWVPPAVRDQLISLCGAELAPEGLLYLNYNTRPGWNIRGMVRDFLLAQTAHVADLAARTQLAQQVAATAAAALASVEHPYAQLMKREYDFVCEGHPSYIAHEFLAPHNHAYWRSEVRAMLGAEGLHYVADADFNYECGRVPQELGQRIEACGFTGMPADDAADLFSYRQLHSAIFARRAPAGEAAVEELAELSIASSLAPVDAVEPGESRFRHPSGFEVTVTAEAMRQLLGALLPRWPRGARLGELLPGVAEHAEDLRLLHRHGLIDLRLVEPVHEHSDPRLAACEERWGGYVTDPYHRHVVLD
jgi:SAM-dependent methyltransferase